jgi:exopolyphosphatase/guanosine-5'-triphosphate,3'-diphosphate pyrophosphatase
LILAAIDIGSNAARLLIVETSVYDDGTVDYTKLNLLRIPLRLGLDVFSTGRISPEREALLLGTMQVYKNLIDLYKVEAVKAAATSAMRDAVNGPELMDKVRAETGIDLKIISGQEEASILYETHIAEALSTRRSYLYIDVGGGSTEVTLFSHNELVAKESFNIGTIRLLQGGVHKEQWEAMKRFLKKNLKGYHPVKAIGTGGNINKIFSVSKRKEGRPLPLAFLKNYYRQLSEQSVRERSHLYGFRKDRADVIVPAMEIYLAVMKWIDADEIYVPKIGLADGLIKILYAERLQVLQEKRSQRA